MPFSLGHLGGERVFRRHAGSGHMVLHNVSMHVYTCVVYMYINMVLCVYMVCV